MASLVSLLMTDIVGSTRRWAVDDAAMSADLETHDRLLREVVAGAGGSVVKHTGDGMLATFDDPAAAVGAAAGIQRVVGEASWLQVDGLQVRAAVHSGVVYERDGDVFGTAVNKLARVLAACPSGGVLVSTVVANLLAERSPEGLAVRSVGEVALSGFATPEVVHAVTGMGLVEPDSVAVAAMAVEGRGGVLPPIDDELIGRVDELAAVWDALGRGRLVTLVGLGGMGKTRLALEVAAGAVDAFADGVWWIDLSNATSADAVVPVAVATVGAREMPGRTALESFCDRFAGRSALLVIDNCEHVLATAQDVVQALRTLAPEVHIVATSREALGARGEMLVPIGSLSEPDGVALFAERATAVQPTLDVETDRTVIERICARLDGIPLAIELAAARCRSMMPSEIDDLLGDRFRLLRGGRSGAERHRTLQAAVAWSYEMLEADERHVFHHLAVFAGGTLIDGLATTTGVDRFELLDILDRLVSRSMVTTARTVLGTRYGQLETLRQFAEDRLAEAGTIIDVRDRHLDWVRELAISIFFSSGTPRGGEGFHRFCAEVDNLRVAVAHAIATGRHNVAHEIVAGCASNAYFRPLRELLDWVRPIRLEGEWTEAAAYCAAWGVAHDMIRGIGIDLWPTGGVPDAVIERYPIVRLAAAFNTLFLPGGWSVAVQMLASVPSDDGLISVNTDGVWLMTQNWRQLSGGPEAEMSDDEFAEIRRRGTTAIDLASKLGDELAQAQRDPAELRPPAGGDHRSNAAARLDDSPHEDAAG